MKANATLLQMKYARIINIFAGKANISLYDGLTFFYHSALYRLVRRGISDLHCMSDDYLADNLFDEYKETHQNIISSEKIP
ncbi:MAG: DUF3791 domain-containing protein [Lachnospiraceae bacterium]|nr:DUF3791 domain-containing protein [Lachnospiraceae bacterium]